MPVSTSAAIALLCSLITVGEMVKVLPSFGGEEALYSSNHCVYVGGRLLLFGQKGDKQPTYSSYRRTVLLGSYAIDVDLQMKTFNRTVFSSIDKAEDRQETIFSVNNQTYMLTYRNHEMCDFVELYLWINNNWKLVPMKVESKAKFGPRETQSSCILHHTVINNDYVLFAFSEERNEKVIFSKLMIAGDAAVIVHLFTIESMSPQYSSTVFSGLYNDKIATVPGSFGCGYRWHPEALLLVNLKQGTFKTKENPSQAKPGWAFGGPIATFQWNDKMLLVGGSIARGLTRMEFSREIWTFDLNTFQYAKLPVEIPEEVSDFNVCAALDSQNGVLYLATAKGGLHKVEL